MEILLF